MTAAVLLVVALASPAAAQPATFDDTVTTSEEVCVEIDLVVERLWDLLDPLLIEAAYAPPVDLMFADADFARLKKIDPSATLVINAMTIGPGVPPNREPLAKILLSQGMIDALAKTPDLESVNPSEASFVLAHEVGHLKLLHTEKVAACKRTHLETRGGDGKTGFDRWFDADATLATIPPEDVVKSFFLEVCRLDLQGHESQADAFALKTLAALQEKGHALNPQAGMRFFERVRQIDPAQDAAGGDHPPISERITEMRRLWAESEALRDKALAKAKRIARRKPKPGCAKAGASAATGKGLKKLRERLDAGSLRLEP